MFRCVAEPGYRALADLQELSYNTPMTKEERGHLAVLKVEERAVEKGYIVSRPSTPSRYDLVIDDGGRLHRVQVKYAGGKSTHSTGVALASMRRHGRTYNGSEIDVVAVYIPGEGTVCWLPPERFANKAYVYVRLQDAKSGQKNGCVFARDYIW